MTLKKERNLFFMGTRGRKSAEDLNLVCIDVQKHRLTPPDFLTDKEREIFCTIVDPRLLVLFVRLNCRCSAPIAKPFR